jgi:hypothetical protein
VIDMTHEKAAHVLVSAGLLDKMDADVAVAVLVSRSDDLRGHARVEALAQAWLLDQARVDEAIAVMGNGGRQVT